MRAIGHQLSKRWLFSWGQLETCRSLLGRLETCTSKSRRPSQRPRLVVEELETRLAPSVDLLSNVATPDVYVVNSNTASPSVSPAGQPAGFSPQQISQAYGFNQITFNNGTIQGRRQRADHRHRRCLQRSQHRQRPGHLRLDCMDWPRRRVSPWSTRPAARPCPPRTPTGASRRVSTWNGRTPSRRAPTSCSSRPTAPATPT